MKKWPDECVDLIYLDPPFKSDTNYNILFGTQNGKPAQLQAFEDTWTWDDKANNRVESIKGAIKHPANKSIKGFDLMLGKSGMLSYLSYMAERLTQMHRLLKQTGSIYLHCDQTASHYLKVVMDDIFPRDSFRREIIWKMSGIAGFKSIAPNYVRGHDTVLYYAKNKKLVTFNKPYTPYNEKQLARFSGIDEDGRKYKPITKSRRLYLDEAKGVAVPDVWTDIANFQTIVNAKEDLGYDTQKPLALLERIINASSNKDDVVLDPFCGCGTTIDASRRLGRQWIGIDISSFAIDLIINERLKDSSIQTAGIPLDLTGAKKLAEADRFAFEKWAINKIPGFAPNEKQVGDGGIDGRATLMNDVEHYETKLALAQVKSGSMGVSDVRDFLHVMEREDAVCGVFITIKKVDGRKRSAHQEFANMGRVEIGASSYPRVQFWSIEEFFDGRFPHLPPMLNPYTGQPMAQRPLL